MGSGHGTGFPAPLAPSVPAPAAPAGVAGTGGNSPAGPDANPGAGAQAVTSLFVLIIGAGLLLAMSRREIALPALLDLRGPHCPG